MMYLVQLARLHDDLRHAQAIGNALSALHPLAERPLVYQRPLTRPSPSVIR